MGPAVNHRSEWVLTCRPDLGKGDARGVADRDVGELPSGLGCSLAAGQRRPLFEALVMVLLGSLLALLASAAALVTRCSGCVHDQEACRPRATEGLKERWLSIQELSGGPYRLGAINRHRQFSLLHAAAKARVMGNIEVAHLALRQSKEARTHQWIDRLSPMMLIERRCSDKR